MSNSGSQFTQSYCGQLCNCWSDCSHIQQWPKYAFVLSYAIWNEGEGRWKHFCAYDCALDSIVYANTLSCILRDWASNDDWDAITQEAHCNSTLAENFLLSSGLLHDSCLALILTFLVNQGWWDGSKVFCCRVASYNSYAAHNDDVEQPKDCAFSHHCWIGRLCCHHCSCSNGEVPHLLSLRYTCDPLFLTSFYPCMVIISSWITSAQGTKLVLTKNLISGSAMDVVGSPKMGFTRLSLINVLLHLKQNTENTEEEGKIVTVPLCSTFTFCVDLCQFCNLMLKIIRTIVCSNLPNKPLKLYILKCAKI